MILADAGCDHCIKHMLWGSVKEHLLHIKEGQPERVGLLVYRIPYIGTHVLFLEE